MMKVLTRNVILFAMVITPLTVLFSYQLYNFVGEAIYYRIPFLAAGYAVLMFLTGLGFGYFDPVRQYRYDLGILYHFITYLVVNMVHAVMLIGMLGFSLINLLMLIAQLLFWGIGLFIHYRLVKSSIKGFHKQEVFP